MKKEEERNEEPREESRMTMRGGGRGVERAEEMKDGQEHLDVEQIAQAWEQV